MPAMITGNHYRCYNETMPIALCPTTGKVNLWSYLILRRILCSEQPYPECMNLLQPYNPLVSSKSSKQEGFLSHHPDLVHLHQDSLHLRLAKRIGYIVVWSSFKYRMMLSKSSICIKKLLASGTLARFL